jgi:KDO2-lipid IV(A) lauroyltransferase
MRVLAYLPLPMLLALGKYLGLILYPLAKKRRHITLVNLKLCFPGLNDQQRQQLAKQVFVENARGFMETAFSWWAPDEKVNPLVEIRGLEHMEAALAEGRGVLLIGIHATMLDLAGRFYSSRMDTDVTYRKHPNAVLNYFMVKARQQRFKNVIERGEMRRALRSLKQGRCVWYASDQDYGAKHSVFAPFFGMPAATVKATSKLLQFNQSRALFCRYYRKNDNTGYVFEVSNPFPELPTGDDVADATAVNAAIEAAVRENPAQYMWVHRRFKSQPDGRNKLYR